MVARGSVVLAEYSSTRSNASAVARQILEKLHNIGESRISYSQGHFIFHAARANGLTFLCMASDTFGRHIPFAFLEDVHSRFNRAFGWLSHTALAYSMNDEFSRVLSHQMDYYSSNPDADSINRLKADINQVQNVVIENIDKVMERGDRIEVVVDKSSKRRNNAVGFRRKTRQFCNSMFWRNFKLVTSLIILVLLVVYIMLAVYCHGATLPTCL